MQSYAMLLSLVFLITFRFSPPTLSPKTFKKKKIIFFTWQQQRQQKKKSPEELEKGQQQN
jgi:hypothetical protein